jgi:hypothetical protein
LTLLALTPAAHADETQAIKTETRYMQGFKDLEIDCSATTVFTVAPTTSVTITAPASELPLLLTKIEGDKLVIKHKESTSTLLNFFHMGDVKIAITGPNLRSIAILGSGSVTAPALTGDAIDLNVTGSGSITATGATTKNLTLDVPGSGEIHLSGIDASTASLSIKGSGAIEAAGKVDQVDSSIAGSGEIRAGDLKAQSIKVEMSGSGELHGYASKAAAVDLTGSGSAVIAGSPAQRTSRSTGSGEIKFY